MAPNRTMIDFSDGVAVWIRGDVTAGYAPFYLAELKPIAGFTEDIGTVIWDTTSLTGLQTLVPSYDPSTMSLISVGTYLSKTGTTAPCNANDGVTYSVTNHPEAVVLYGDLKNGHLATGTATGADGGAYIILTPASALEYVSVVGVKAGCTVRNAGYVYTGRTPIAPGVTSTGLGF